MISFTTIAIYLSTFLRHRAHRRVSWSFVYLLLTIFFHSLIVWIVFVTNIRNSISPNYFWLAYGTVASILIAERLSRASLFIFVRSPLELHRLHHLETKPSVALLYCTCDDVVIECITQLIRLQYSELSIFVLDDSQSAQYRQLIDSYCAVNGYTIVRRSKRDGYKAGNINNWLSNYGSAFDYFIVLDADSFLPPNFVEEMLSYAEHPQNTKVALFESIIYLSRPSSLLQKAISVQFAIGNKAAYRLSNRLGLTLSNGHNNLCRVSSFLTVGGFDEHFIGEDRATALNLLGTDFDCSLVNVKSFEICPANLSTIRKRNYRWVRNDLQLMKHPMLGISLALQFKIMIRMLSHCIWIPFTFAATLLLWTQQSSFSNFIEFIGYFFYLGFREPQYILLMAIFTICLMYFYFSNAFEAFSAKIGIREYLISVLVFSCLAFSNMFTTLRAIFDALVGARFKFIVTPKQDQRQSRLTYSYQNWPLFILSFFVVLGVLRNPAGLVFNWPWLIPLISSPFILYWAQSRRQ